MNMDIDRTFKCVDIVAKASSGLEVFSDGSTYAATATLIQTSCEVDPGFRTSERDL